MFGAACAGLVRLALTIGVLGAMCGAGVADEFIFGDLLIDHPWARATAGAGKTGVAYMSLAATGEQADRLVGIASPVAERAALHTHIIEDDIARMRRVEAVEVVPGSPTVLDPGGLHIMLMGLTRPLVEGERFPLTLEFEQAGSVVVEVVVKGVGSME